MAIALEGTPVHNNATSGSSLTTGAFTTTQDSEVFISVTINSTSVSSISGGSLTWALRKSQGTGGGNFIDLWAAHASSALSAVQFTVNFAGSAAFVTTDVFAFAGQDTSTIWDANGSVPAGNTSNPVQISTSNANDAIIAGFRCTTGSPTEGSGFTKVSGADFQLVEYQVVSATQTNLNCDTGGASANSCLADAIMQGAGGGGGPTTAGILLVPGNMRGNLGNLFGRFM